MKLYRFMWKLELTVFGLIFIMWGLNGFRELWW